MVIYYFENVSYAYSSWQGLFKEIVEYYKKEYGAEVIRKTNYPGPGGISMYIEEFDYEMADCELLIYDKENDILKAISYSEHYTKIWEDVFVKRNKKGDLLLITQFYNWFNKVIETGKDNINLSDYNFTVSQTVFYTIQDNSTNELINPDKINIEDIYNKRKNIQSSDLEDKLFMLYTTERFDPVKLSELGYLNKDLTPKKMGSYFEELIKYKIGLAIGTTAEYSYREMEYMAIGVPFLRVEYMTQLNPPLIPNYHYIAIDRAKYNLPYNNGLDRLGGENYIKAYIDRFLEVKEDQEFLNYIAKNARQYYLNYCSPENRLSHALKLLQIK